MSKSPDRLTTLRFIHLHRSINKEAVALGFRENDLTFINEHPDFERWNKLRLQMKKLDPVWLAEYLKPR